MKFQLYTILTILLWLSCRYSSVEIKLELQKNILKFGIYNAETLENLVKSVHALHNRQSLYESLFAGQTSAAYKAYSQMHGAHIIQHYAINLMLYLHTIKDKYIKIYNEFILQLYIYMLKLLEF